MRLTLWQQFSSNHSAEYTVVGVFRSAEQAAQMGETLQELVVDIHEWHTRDGRNPPPWEPSPAEQRIAQSHSINWREPVDWLSPFSRTLMFPYQRAPEEHIITWDRLVIVESPEGSATWQTGHQFVALMQASGAQTYRHVYDGQPPDSLKAMFQRLHVQIALSAPDAALLARIEASLAAQSMGPIPWVSDHPRYANLTGGMPAEEFVRLEREWVLQEAAWQAYLKDHQHEPGRWSMRSTFITIDSRTDAIIRYLRDGVSVEWKRQGDQVVIITRGRQFSTQIAAFGAWITRQGCSVTCTFTEDGA